MTGTRRGVRTVGQDATRRISLLGCWVHPRRSDAGRRRGAVRCGPGSGRPVGVARRRRAVAVCSLAVWLTGALLTPVSAFAATAATPSEPSVRIVIDLNRPVLRLYRGDVLERAYPVALGAPQMQTPIGEWRIVDKQKDWGGGFGTRWLGLNVPWGTYGIHGTNRPESIGTYQSHGCIRMYNPDVEELYERVPLGTPVSIHGDPLQHYRVLVQGNVGADVLVLQRRLRALGWYPGKLDGRFGSGLEWSVLLFELSRGLPMDGQVDRGDLRALGLVQSKTG